MKVTNKKLTAIKPYGKNPRKNEAAVDAVAKSIEQFGFQQPIVVDKAGVIIVGHTRLLAAKQLGLETVPVVVADNLSEEQAKAYRLTDNKTNELAEWDFDLLNAELTELIDFDMQDFGFDVPEEIFTPQTEPDDVPDVENEKPKSKLGEVYTLGKHRIMCGDSTDAEQVAKLMDGKKADMVFTDPPYGIKVVKSNTIGGGGAFGGKKNEKLGKSNFIKANKYSEIAGDETTEAAQVAFEICIKLGFANMIIWGGNYFTDFLPASRGWVCWDKIDGVEGTTKNFSDIELAWTTFDVPARIVRHRWQGLLKASEHKDSRVHPTQKPIALAVECFSLYKAENLILDLFLGSGSTLIACEQTNRICYGMELDEHYCDVIRKRWAEFVHGKECDWKKLTPKATDAAKTIRPKKAKKQT